MISLNRTKVTTQEKDKVICTHELGGVKSSLEIGKALEDFLIVSLKEGKKHVTYSLDRVEEMALYQMLKERNDK